MTDLRLVPLLVLAVTRQDREIEPLSRETPFIAVLVMAPTNQILVAVRVNDMMLLVNDKLRAGRDTGLGELKDLGGIAQQLFLADSPADQLGYLRRFDEPLRLTARNFGGGVDDMNHAIVTQCRALPSPLPR